MELAKSIDCPICGKSMKLDYTPVTITFRGQNYDIDWWHYPCKNCNEEFTTDISENKNLSQIPGYANIDRRREEAGIKRRREEDIAWEKRRSEMYEAWVKNQENNKS